MEVTEVPKQSSYLGGTCFAFTLRQSCGHVVLGTEIYAALGDVDSRTVQSFRCEDRLNLKPEGPQKTAGPPFHLIEGSKHNRNRKKQNMKKQKKTTNRINIRRNMPDSVWTEPKATDRSAVFDEPGVRSLEQISLDLNVCPNPNHMPHSYSSSDA